MKTINGYWETLNGNEYNAMFDGKYVEEHKAQAEFLLKNTQAESFVLEYGCGPGRLVRILDAAGRCVDGYDQSPVMTLPLEDMIFYRDVTEVRLTHNWELVSRHSYELAYTASVLIHNTTENVKTIIGQLAQVSDRVILIENKLYRGDSIRNSEEHDGCYYHDYQALYPGKWKVTDLSRTHDAYELLR